MMSCNRQGNNGVISFVDDGWLSIDSTTQRTHRQEEEEAIHSLQRTHTQFSYIPTMIVPRSLVQCKLDASSVDVSLTALIYVLLSEDLCAAAAAFWNSCRSWLILASCFSDFAEFVVHMPKTNLSQLRFDENAFCCFWNQRSQDAAVMELECLMMKTMPSAKFLSIATAEGACMLFLRSSAHIVLCRWCWWWRRKIDGLHGQTITNLRLRCCFLEKNNTELRCNKGCYQSS